jgi:hypothetical protein
MLNYLKYLNKSRAQVQEIKFFPVYNIIYFNF